MDRLVLGEIVGWFVGSVFLFSSLILASGELIRFAEYLQSGESVLLVAQLLAYTMPSILSLTFPIAMLLSALLGVGRLSSGAELIALIAAGASFERIMLSIGIFGLLVSLIGVWFTNSVVPAANAGRQHIIDNVAQHGNLGTVESSFNQTIRNSGTGQTLQLHAEGGISLGERQAGSATLHNLSLEVWKTSELQYVLYASRADWMIGTNEWALGGKIYGFSFPDRALLSNATSLATEPVVLGKPDELQSLKEVRVEDVSTKSLRKRSKLFRQNGDASDAREADVEVARRIALPFASFVFALVGAPLGVRPPRSGQGMGFGIAVGITFLYWTLLQLFTIVGRGGIVPPWLAVMIPNLLGLGVGLFLIRRVSRGV